MKLYHQLLFCAFFCFAFYSNLNGQSQLEIARNYIVSNNKITTLNLQDLVVSSSHTSKQSGLTHFYFNQSLHGIKIYNAISNVAIDQSGKVFFAGDRIVNNKNYNSKSERISATDAALNAAKHFNLPIQDQSRVLKEDLGVTKKTTLINKSISNQEIQAELMYVHIDGQLILTWSISFEKADDKYWWDVKIDAQSGSFVEKTSWTLECGFGSSHHSHDHANNHLNHKHSTQDYSTKSHDDEHFAQTTNKKTIHFANGDYQVCAMPNESPNHGPISIVNSPWSDNLDAAAHPFNWHSDGSNTYFTTRGNNVWAVEDRDANNNQSTGFSPASQLGNNGQQYNYTPNFNLAPIDYEEAAITNLFYWNNIMHDVTYHYGFDEASGNFQSVNNTGNGLGGDPLYADTQDGLATNFARITVFPEGQICRMEMFDWVQPFTTDFFNVTSPINTSLEAFPSQFGPNATFAGTVILAKDTNGGSSEACSANPISNGSAINGNVALIDRGNCSFVQKVLNAQNQGAIAAIICNNVPSTPINMSGSGNIAIPSVMISQSDCATLRVNLPATINVTTTSTSGGPNKEASYDNLVIAHEYAHGITVRLTGGSSVNGCFRGDDQMGEGWSDFFGLVMTMKPGDVATQERGIATYLKGEVTTAQGLRPFPYSTDFAINPMTYGNSDDGGAFTIPHGVGSIWCSMLWDMTWKFIDLYGFGTDIYDSDISNVGTPASPGTFGGQNLALQLVMEGLKLQPCRPGFIDGRDAILAADRALYGGIHRCLIWEAFADRGLGVSAKQGAVEVTTDNEEAFDLPSAEIEKSTNTVIEQVGNTVSYDIHFAPVCEAQDNIVITDILDPTFTLSSVTCQAPASHSVSGNTLTISHPGLQVGQKLSCNLTVDINSSQAITSQILLFDDVEGSSPMTVNTILGSAADAWSVSNSDSQSGVNSWFVETTFSNKFTTLETPAISLGQFPVIRFFHQYNTLGGWDGGYLEVSTNNGASWQQLPLSAFLQNGYNAYLVDSSNSIIDNKQAWTGNSGGFIETIADLSSYANTTAKIRFSFGQTSGKSNEGWWIDDISIKTGIPNITNTACAISDQLASPICDAANILVDFTDCDDFITETSNPAITNSLEANIAITHNGIVNTNTNIDFNAGQCISLTAGFEVSPQAQFHAYIQACQ